MIKLYKIKWIEPGHGMGPDLDRVAFVLAENVEQIAKAYPTLTSVDFTGIVTDLRK